MYYVVIEVEIVQRAEAPKDHGRVKKLSYQFIDSDSLKAHYDDDKIPCLDMDEEGLSSFQDSIGAFDKELQKVVGNDEFVLCSLNSTWHIRVTIPRQARDDGFILPSYLQHPRVFDVWKEYDRWCANHPEVLVLRKNCNGGTRRPKNQAEILKVLEISSEEIVSQPVLGHTVHILVQLRRKCTTKEDLTDVLTRPYDSHLDIRNFLQEKSKVLYLNNLPPDTTQSELESWFTQFGARPVGFWTVKNIVEETANINNNWSMNNSPYVEEQDSISGFVVFQTHEEATEVLVLNGRSILSNMANTKQPRVVEHIVEIQPSSTRVLDRAQEILSPFPQSKNKPRPGDWNCPSCGFSNFQRRTACFRCSFPAVSAVQVNNKQYLNYNGVMGANQNSNNGYTKSNGSPTQSYYQTNSLNAQNSTAKTNTTFSDPNSLKQTNLGYRFNGNGAYGSNTSLANYSNNRYISQQSNNSNGGSNVPFRAGDWKCPACTYHNFAKNLVCLRCGAAKMTTLESEGNQNSNAVKLTGSNNNGGDNGNNGKGNYNRYDNGNLGNLTQFGSTASLIEHDTNSKGNGYFTRSINNVSGGELGVKLNTRSASEPKW
ncbi:hypothetical protein HG537_0B05200 [Torulaspora globosa]|uniref:Uncharacterized protein n=1 Tax=Torulaspora globosa TaxID=48254 RepID=A0A7H9HPA4_9SACH|nr:hypothetical protein HG537_0B05200 [Torulaspora sp. CBS 2947]